MASRCAPSPSNAGSTRPWSITTSAPSRHCSMPCSRAAPASDQPGPHGGDGPLRSGMTASRMTVEGVASAFLMPLLDRARHERSGLDSNYFALLGPGQQRARLGRGHHDQPLRSGGAALHRPAAACAAVRPASDDLFYSYQFLTGALTADPERYRPPGPAIRRPRLLVRHGGDRAAHDRLLPAGFRARVVLSPYFAAPDHPAFLAGEHGNRIGDGLVDDALEARRQQRLQLARGAMPNGGPLGASSKKK